ncbi:MAG TPA: FliM/FliN family flagellar motor switch protein [Candidatus Gastranaerophilaceae bacterium]|nr:FliM/FliN family flagellar motor switch protein [Candidatus Gastranaerophilaceae bacterium]HPT41681.1 FliM/FliN family flagellar motor switch protein [Candidatus Gastranaerophilaceae bacterium]
MANFQKEQLNEFFQFFNDTVKKALLNNLDKEVCKNIDLQIESNMKVQDVESLKNNQALYQLEYVLGELQGSLIVTLPENLIFHLADILMCGGGKKDYSGVLSEIETNSFKKLLEQVFKALEKTFKVKYDKNLVFSEKASLTLKEDDKYQTIFSGLGLDFQVVEKITINDSEEYIFNLLLNYATLEELMNLSGINYTEVDSKKINVNATDLKRLSDVKINITAELGRAQIPIKYALELVRGSVVELDTLNNSDIKVFVNGSEFAKAQIFAVEDNYGLKITEIISPEERMQSL